MLPAACIYIVFHNMGQRKDQCGGGGGVKMNTSPNFSFHGLISFQPYAFLSWLVAVDEFLRP